MNKEEILDVLNAIGHQIDEANISEYQLDERVSQFEELLKAIEETKAEIKTLSEKLTNDDNYPQRIPYLYDESTIFYLEDRLLAREKEEQDNLDSIKEYQRLIDEAHRKIKHHEILIAISERKYREEVMEKGPELRDALDLTQEEFEKLSSALRDKQKRLESYKENLENINEDLLDYEAKLSELLAKTDELKRSREEAELQLDLYSKEANSRTLVDEEAKISDRRKLSDAEERLAEFERIEARITYDHEKKLSEMIEGYKNGSISHEELIERLTEFKANLNEEFVAENIQETYSSEEYSSNISVQEKLEREIAELEAKLANDDNYLVSPFVIERNNRNIVRVQRNIQSIDKQIKGYTEENANLQEDIVTANEMIEELEREIENCQRQIRRLGADIEPEVEKLLLADIASHKADIVYLENTKLEATRIIEHNSVELETLVSKQERFRIVCERMQSSLSRKNSTDLTARRLDEIDLTRKKSALEALKRRGLISNVSIIENIDKILGGQLEGKVEEVTPEVPTPDAPVDDNGDEPIVPEDEKEEPIVSEDEIDETTISEEQSVVEESTKSDEQPVVEGPTIESLESSFGMDPIGLGDTRGWKAKYSEKEDEELAKKAKDKKFVKKLKGFFNGVLNIIPHTVALTTSLVLAGLHPIKTAKAIKEYMKRVQENPEKYGKHKKEDAEREVMEIAKADGAVIEEPEVQIEETIETPEVRFEEINDEEIVIPTNDGETISVDVSGGEEELEVSDIEFVPVDGELESIPEDEMVSAEELLSDAPTIDEASLEMDGLETPVVEENSVTEEPETQVEETEVEAPTMEEQSQIQAIEDFLATVEDEELDIPVEAMDQETPVEEVEVPAVEEVLATEEPEAQVEETEVTNDEPEVQVEEPEEQSLSARLSRLSEEEINDIIAQISSEMAYNVEAAEIEEEARKLR